MKIEQNFKDNDPEEKTENEEAHNAWVKEMNKKQAVFGNFKMDRAETPINDDDFLEVYPETEKGEGEKDEHLERVTSRIDQVKQRQEELYGMKNSEDVREEKRELEKELKSLEEEVEKNTKNKEQERLLAKEEKKQNEHLERVNARMTQVKQRQEELFKMANSEDVREEKKELEKELESLKKEIGEKDDNKEDQPEAKVNSLRQEIGEKMDEQKEKNTGGNIESKNSEENIKKITNQIYGKISFYEDKKAGLSRFNIFEKSKLRKIADNLELINKTIILDKLVNIKRLENLSKNKGLKELCNLIKNESSIVKINKDNLSKSNN